MDAPQARNDRPLSVGKSSFFEEFDTVVMEEYEKELGSIDTYRDALAFSRDKARMEKLEAAIQSGNKAAIDFKNDKLMPNVEAGLKNPVLAAEHHAVLMIAELDASENRPYLPPFLARGIGLGLFKPVSKEDARKSNFWANCFNLQDGAPLYVVAAHDEPAIYQLLQRLATYKRELAVRLKVRLASGELPYDLAAREAAELFLVRTYRGAKPKESEEKSALKFHYKITVDGRPRSFYAWIAPWPSDPKNPDSNQESAEVFTHLEEARRKASANPEANLANFVLSEDEVHESPGTEWMKLLAGGVGEVVLTDSWKRKTDAGEEEYTVGTRVVRRNDPGPLQCVAVSHAEWADQLFGRTTKDGHVYRPVYINHEYQVDEAGKVTRLTFESGNHRLDARLLKFLYDGTRRATESGATMGEAKKSVASAEEAEFAGFREAIKVKADVSRRDLLYKKVPGRAAILHNAWKGHDGVARGFTDALVESDGDIIRIVEANDRAKNSVLRGHDFDKPLGSLAQKDFPGYVWAWLASATDAEGDTEAPKAPARPPRQNIDDDDEDSGRGSGKRDRHQPRTKRGERGERRPKW